MLKMFLIKSKWLTSSGIVRDLSWAAVRSPEGQDHNQFLRDTSLPLQLLQREAIQKVLAEGAFRLRRDRTVTMRSDLQRMSRS